MCCFYDRFLNWLFCTCRQKSSLRVHYEKVANEGPPKSHAAVVRVQESVQFGVGGGGDLFLPLAQSSRTVVEGIEATTWTGGVPHFHANKEPRRSSFFSYCITQSVVRRLLRWGCISNTSGKESICISPLPSCDFSLNHRQRMRHRVGHGSLIFGAPQQRSPPLHSSAGFFFANTSKFEGAT